MLSREQPSRLSFTNTRGRGGRLRPDYGNHFYFKSSRGRGGAPATKPVPNVPSELDLKEGLDATTIIATIPAPASPGTAPEHFPIENVKYVASYNWIDAEQPTIVVPGSPAEWTGRNFPFTLRPDDAFVYVDRYHASDSAQLSQYPMLPLLAAADAIHSQGTAPPVDWPTVDVIADCNGLRKLLRWINPSPGRELFDFRIDVQLVGTKTLVLSRWESPRSEVPTNRFGHAFETAMTHAAPGCPSSGHHRAITYDMLNMKMIVRFRVDACLPSLDSSTIAMSIDDSDQADALGDVNIQQPSTSTPATSPGINIVRAGTQVPQDALVEMISRSVFYLDQLDWNEVYPRLALSQIPSLRLGVHQRGEFIELREWQLDGHGAQVDAGTPRQQSWAQKGADVLDLSVQRQETAVQIVRLAKVLQDVQTLAIARGSGPAGSFSLVCENGELRVYAREKVGDGEERDGKGLSVSCLPPEAVARFETRIDRVSDT